MPSEPHTASGELLDRIRTHRREWLSLLAVLGLGWYVFYVDLGSYPLLTWDEAIYADVARRMVETGDWLVPRTAFRLGRVDAGPRPFLHKPPLAFWLQAAAMQVLGVNEFAARLPSATFALLTAGVVYLFGRETESRRTGLAAAVVFVANPFLTHVNNGARFGGTDTILTAFGSALVLCVWLAVDREDARYLVPGGAAAGLAFLTKGFAAGVFALVLAPLVWTGRSALRRRPRTVAAGVGVAALLALPWPLYAWTRFGDAFLQPFLVEQVLGRVGGDLTVYPGATFEFMKYPYFETLLFDHRFYYPHLFFALPAAALALWTAFRGDVGDRADRFGRRDASFLLWWAGSVLGFFAVTGNHPWYLVPMFVATAVLVGRMVAGATRLEPAALAGVLFGLVGTAAFDPELGPYVLAVPVAAVVVLLGREALRDGPLAGTDPSFARHAAVVALLLAAGLGAAGYPETPQFGDSHDQVALADRTEERLPPGATVYVQPRLPMPVHAFAFYADRPLESASAAAMNGNDGIRFALVRAAAIDSLDGVVREIRRVRLRRSEVVLVELGRENASDRATSP